MTATLQPPPAPAPAEVGRPAAAPAPADGRRGAPRHPVLAEVLLAVLTVVAVAGFLRLFADADAVLPLFVAGLGAHAVGAAGRRLGWGVAATALATLVALVVQVSLLLYPHTSAYGLPTPATLDRVLADLGDAWDLFGRIEAPAPRSRGFLVAASVMLWIAAALADWAAFRVRAVLEAILPAASVFVFCTLLGRGGGGVVLAGAMAAAVLGFTAAQRAARSARDDAWVGGRVRQGAGSQARVGLLVALAVALLAGAVGPRLPTAGDEALIDWRGDDGPDARTTVSPLVDIRSRLVQQSNATLFTVESPKAAYWRMTSLDVFDGQVWSSSETFDEADGELPSEPPAAATSPLEQTFTIRNLRAIWAPAALTPTELVDASTDLRWNGGLTTLIVPRDTASTDGATYTVVSQVPTFTPEDLDAEYPAELPDDVADALALPAGLPPLVTELAAEAVAGAGPLPYDRARALQDWFRDGFTYDLEGVGAGHSASAIEAFLISRRGYCEQFAGTYAAMARSLGLPARVAVGFTPGDLRADGLGYTVRGRNAHAWPEVWLPGAGWVPFEPTPGRGQPGAEAYTDVPPQQDETDRSAVTTTTAGPGPTTTAPGTPGSRPLPPEARGEVDTSSPTTAADDGGTPAWLLVLSGLLVLAVVLLVVDVVAIAVIRSRRSRAGRGDDSVAGRVRRSWATCTEALGLVGVRPRSSETAREFARRAGAALDGQGPALTRLAAMVTTATWAPTGAALDPALATDAEGIARGVVESVQARGGRKERLRRAVDPRLL